MTNSQAESCFYQRLKDKVEKHGFTLISFVPDEPESKDHAALAFTIGLSKFGCPELLFANAYFDEIQSFSEQVLESLKDGRKLNIGSELSRDFDNTPVRLIELEDGVKEQLTAQARYYFDLFHSKNFEYDVAYVGLADEFGIFPNDKLFIPNKHIKQQFYKNSPNAGMFGGKNLVSNTSSILS